MQDYFSVKKEALSYYKSLIPVFSEALKIEITFNAKGFNHILYESGATARVRKEQISRFNLLSTAYELIKFANIFQEYEYDEVKNIYYWGIIAIYKNNKVKVILKRNGKEGKVIFWSVIPQYITNLKRDIKMMKGYPENN